MRRLSLVVAQFGSFVMVFVSVYFALVPFFRSEFANALLVGVGGVLYWTAMFHVFGAVLDYLKEKQQRQEAAGANAEGKERMQE